MKKLPSIKSLQKKAESLWKHICHLRDGRACQIKVNFPVMGIHHSDIFQVDHCFSRQNKNLFLDPSNGTVVCSTCNRMKHYHQKSVGRLIDRIVLMREGSEKFMEMQETDTHRNPNLLWHNREWLENKITDLTRERNKYLEHRAMAYD